VGRLAQRAGESGVGGRGQGREDRRDGDVGTQRMGAWGWDGLPWGTWGHRDMGMGSRGGHGDTGDGDVGTRETGMWGRRRWGRGDGLSGGHGDTGTWGWGCGDTGDGEVGKDSQRDMGKQGHGDELPGGTQEMGTWGHGRWGCRDGLPGVHGDTVAQDTGMQTEVNRVWGHSGDQQGHGGALASPGGTQGCPQRRCHPSPPLQHPRLGRLRLLPGGRGAGVRGTLR